MRNASVWVSRASSALVGSFTRRKRSTPSGRSAYTPSRKSIWKRTFRFSALPQRWIRVTAPAWAVLRENPALLPWTLQKHELGNEFPIRSLAVFPAYPLDLQIDATAVDLGNGWIKAIDNAVVFAVARSPANLSIKARAPCVSRFSLRPAPPPCS